MKKLTIVKQGLVAGALLGSLHAGGQTLRYNHRPILIHLKPQVERWVSFPERVQVDARGSGLTQGMLRLLNNQGTLYLTAYRPFSQRRLLVRLLKSGKTVLVDVKSDKQGTTTPMTVLIKHSHQPEHRLSRSHSSPALHRTVNVLQLIRFAIQQLYGDHTLHVIGSPLIKAMPLSASNKMDHALPRLFHNPALRLIQSAQWRTTQAPSVTITAIQIKNTGHRPIILHPEQLCGHFKAASLYPFATLNGRGQPHHETHLFLISHQSFVIARRGCP